MNKKSFLVFNKYFLAFINLFFLSFSLKASINDDPKELHPLFILSIDGGGIRGILPAAYLSNFEQKLENRFGARIRLSELFDVMLGTSTGGLISLALNTPNKHQTSPRYDAYYMVNFYKKKGEDIFPQSKLGKLRKIKAYVRSTKYSREPLDKIVKKTIGDTLLSEAFSSLIIPSINASTGQLTYFTNTDSYNPHILMSDVALATSAAPHFLGSYKDSRGITYLDGGLIANNPSLSFLQVEKIVEALKENREIYMLSLDTGIKTKRIDYRTLDSSGIGIASNVQKFLSLIMQGTNERTDLLLDNFKKVYNNFHYFRINFDIPNDSFDKVDKEHLEILESIGKEKFQKDLKNLPDLETLLQAIDPIVLLQKRLMRHRRLSGHEDDLCCPTYYNYLDLSSIPLLKTNFELNKYDFNHVTQLYLSDVCKSYKDCLNIIDAITPYFKSVEVFDFSKNDLGKDLDEENLPNMINLLFDFSPLKVFLLHSNGLEREKGEYISLFLSHLINGKNTVMNTLRYLDLSYNHSHWTNNNLQEIIEKVPELKLLNLVATKAFDSLNCEEKNGFEILKCSKGSGQVSKKTFERLFNKPKNAHLNFILY